MTQETKYIPQRFRELKDKKYSSRYERGRKKANDNLQYGTKKYAIQSFNDSANIMLDSLDSGLTLSPSNLKRLDSKYKDLKDVGASTESADKKIKQIKNLYKEQQNMKKKGKDPFVEKQAFDI